MGASLMNPDREIRCFWCIATPEYIAYHDTEWGFPVSDDQRLFEKLSLEAFQSGLSWRTILSKRDNFRAAFHGFDFDRVARFTPRDVNRLLANAGIIRHRGKIEAVVNNARKAQDLVGQEGSLAAYLWQYEPTATRHHNALTASISPESRALAKDLKKRGWQFIGPTTAYAFMQAMGLVNDHARDCVIRGKAELARDGFKRPGR